MQNLDQNFWSRFAKTTWEKKSVAISNIHSPLLQLDESVIFDLLVDYSSRCRRLKSADGMKFYIQGHRQFDSEVLRHLPKKSDGSLSGYHQRMGAQYDDYCLVCDELLQMANQHQESLEDFTSLLFESVGFPNRFAEMGLYLGNYRKTPFGVHEDACGVFSFPVVGKKKFRIWSPVYVAKNPSLVRAFKYAKHKAASQVLEASVGDMTYWPSSAWHIAESNGDFSATWSLGVWVDKKQSDVVSEVMNQLYSEALGAVGDARMMTLPDQETLPPEILQSLGALAAVTPDRIRSAFIEAWMKHVSMRGLKTHPKSDLSVKPNSRLKLASKSRPVLMMRDGLSTVYAFNGATLRSSSAKLKRFFEDLNRGANVRAPSEYRSLQEFAKAGAFA